MKEMEKWIGKFIRIDYRNGTGIFENSTVGFVHSLSTQRLILLIDDDDDEVEIAIKFKDIKEIKEITE
jgi:hypothetical protein